MRTNQPLQLKISNASEFFARQFGKSLTYLAGLTNQRVVSTPLPDDVTDEMFLPIVGCQDGDLVSGVTDQAHVHKNCDCVLGFSKILQNTTGPRAKKQCLPKN